ncbi:MAG TPA: LacI family DNA-binding transcriptional regulator [Chryseolinea sp.]|nr:LacI family DNA-binding transcriptional regulator [Chryseolinea sp.]
MENKEITIYDIAKALQISASTVSRGLNDDNRVGKKTKNRILEAARSMQYQRNIYANKLRSKHTNTLGVIIPRVNSYFMSTVIAGMEKVANERGYMLIISQSQESAKKENSMIQTMFNSRVDGLLVSLAADTRNLKHFNKVFDKNIPVIFFDRVVSHPNCATISIDNRKAGYDATSHLIEQGCKQIVFIGGNQNRNVYADRLAGYQQALIENGIEYDSSRILINGLTEQDGMEAAKKILKMDPMPDGIFASNDASAVSCLSELTKAGITIPEQIAIVGFNNDPVSRAVKPGLTTIEYPGFEMGEVSASNIIDAINRQTPGIFKSVMLNHNLIIRQSSKNG